MPEVTALFEIAALVYFGLMRQILIIDSAIAHNVANCRTSELSYGALTMLHSGLSEMPRPSSVGSSDLLYFNSRMVPSEIANCHPFNFSSFAGLNSSPPVGGTTVIPLHTTFIKGEFFGLNRNWCDA